MPMGEVDTAAGGMVAAAGTAVEAGMKPAAGAAGEAGTTTADIWAGTSMVGGAPGGEGHSPRPNSVTAGAGGGLSAQP
jgi:hypothetical protein